MEGFVGKDISEVYVQYGPPMNRFEMPDGRHAFQWHIQEEFFMPSTTTINTYGGMATAQTYGGGIYSNSCYYTLYAKPNSAKSFTVVGFEQPRIDCE